MEYGPKSQEYGEKMIESLDFLRMYITYEGYK
jgi:hypothetical protein